MTMAEFSLFHLDPKVIINILEYLDVYKIVNLSLCSIKSFNFAKQAIFERDELCETSAAIALEDQRLEFSLTTCAHSNLKSSTYELSCRSLSESVSCPTRLTSGEVYGTPFLQSMTSRQMTFFWEDEYNGMRILFKHIMMLYDGTPLYDITVDIDYKYHLEGLDFVISNNLKEGRLFDIVTICSKNNFILKTWDIFDRLSPDTCQTVECDVELDAPIRELVYSQLTVFTASWVTSQWLLAFNCKEISLEEANITSADINVYLKGWAEGACSNVERIDFGEVEVDYPVMMEGILPSPFLVTLRWHRGSRHACFTVHRRDGTAAATITAGNTLADDLTLPGKYQLRMEVLDDGGTPLQSL